MDSKTSYDNVEVIQQGGGRKKVRRVTIRGGKGKKSVSYYRRGKRVETVSQPIHPVHVGLILAKRFIPGLFADCKTRKMRYRRK